MKTTVTLAEGANVSIGECVTLTLDDGASYKGIVCSSSSSAIEIDLFEGEGLLGRTIEHIYCSGHRVCFPFSTTMLGRSFNGAGHPIDGGDEIIPEILSHIDSPGITQAERQAPSECLSTGICIIDGLIPLYKGETIGLFFPPGIPDHIFIRHIIRQIPVEALCYAGVDVSPEREALLSLIRKEEGIESKSATFVNLSNEPIHERDTAPKMALSLAEYLAFEHDMTVVVILDNMSTYPDNTFRKLYARAGKRKDKKGSITLISLFHLKAFNERFAFHKSLLDASIIFSYELYLQGIYPPIDVGASHSRLVHIAGPRHISIESIDKLKKAYLYGKLAFDRSCKRGEERLSRKESEYVKFYEEFNQQLVRQNNYESRCIEDTIKHCHHILSRIPDDTIEVYEHKPEKKAPDPTHTAPIKPSTEGFHIRQSLFLPARYV
ncbi:MAG: hypothetical protein ACMUJM_14645 [bacterium]